MTFRLEVHEGRKIARVTFDGVLSGEHGERSARAVGELLARSPMFLEWDVTRMQSYERRAREAWGSMLLQHRNAILGITVIGGSALVRVGASGLALLLGTVAQFVDPRDATPLHGVVVHDELAATVATRSLVRHRSGRLIVVRAETLKDATDVASIRREVRDALRTVGRNAVLVMDLRAMQRLSSSIEPLLAAMLAELAPAFVHVSLLHASGAGSIELQVQRIAMDARLPHESICVDRPELCEGLQQRLDADEQTTLRTLLQARN